MLPGPPAGCLSAILWTGSHQDEGERRAAQVGHQNVLILNWVSIPLLSQDSCHSVSDFCLFSWAWEHVDRICILTMLVFHLEPDSLLSRTLCILLSHNLPLGLSFENSPCEQIFKFYVILEINLHISGL